MLGADGAEAKTPGFAARSSTASTEDRAMLPVRPETARHPRAKFQSTSPGSQRAAQPSPCRATARKPSRWSPQPQRQAIARSGGAASSRECTEHNDIASTANITEVNGGGGRGGDWSNPSVAPMRWRKCPSACRGCGGNTRSKRSSSAGRSCWCRSSRRSAAPKARR